MMNRLLILPVLLLTLLVGKPAYSADYKKGIDSRVSLSDLEKQKIKLLLDLDATDRGVFATALRQWKLLAEQGDADAQFKLGFMYAKGQGVPKDDKTAVKWFTLAAEQGNAYNQYFLGVMYYRGRDIPKDYKAAVKWFTLAAEQREPYAQRFLGEMYNKGRGVPKDDVYAHMWGNLSASNGSQSGGELRDDVAKIMTPAQIEKAQNLARECVRKKYKGC